jgi:pilus assembly protein Flp/PilA
MKKLRVLTDNRGVGTIEYALIASLISVAAIGAFESVGSQVRTNYANVDESLSGAQQP